MIDTPPEPVPYYHGPPLKPYVGIRAGSRAFGAVALILGGLSGCMGLAVPLLLTVKQPGHPTVLRPSVVVAGALFYLAVGVAGIAFGLGAVRLRRWVRPLGMIGGVLGTLGGMAFVVIMAFSLSATEAEMRSRRSAAPVTANVFPLLFLMIVLLGIIVPALFFWFFRKPQVRAMLEYYDPAPRWTDKYPVPVLGLAVALAVFGLNELVSAPEAIAPIFGRVYSGPPTVGIHVAECAITFSLVPLVLRRRAIGWWGSLVLCLVLSVAYGATIVRADRIEQYRRAGFTNTQLTSMEMRGAAGQLAAVVPQAIFSLAYLIYVRRYFLKARYKDTA